MGIYTVHMKGSPDEPSAIERAVFVREGFGWWAFLLGPAWLAWNRAWLALVGWIVLQVALGFMTQAHLIHVGAQTGLELIIALALGFEAGTLRRYVLRRRGFQMIDVVQERSISDAERRFFSRIHMNETPITRAQVNVPAPHLVGLFPSAGA